MIVEQINARLTLQSAAGLPCRIQTGGYLRDGVAARGINRGGDPPERPIGSFTNSKSDGRPSLERVELHVGRCGDMIDPNRGQGMP